jgi:hypothetical protein
MKRLSLDEVMTPTNPQWIVDYTRAALDTRHLIAHLRLHRAMTPALYDLVAAILAGTIKAKLRAPKGWTPTAKYARDYYKRVRGELEAGDLLREGQAQALRCAIDTKGKRTKAAQAIVADIHRVSWPTYNEWMYPGARRKRKL